MLADRPAPIRIAAFLGVLLGAWLPLAAPIYLLGQDDNQVTIATMGLLFVEANLEEANLHGANLAGATLTGANLLCADLDDANLSGVSVTGACLIGTRLAAAKR